MERKRVGGRFAGKTEGGEEAGCEGPSEDEAAVASAPESVLKPARLRYCRKLVTHKVAEAMPSIVDKFATEALKGSIDHARALAKLGSFEMDESRPVKQTRRGKSFAGRLLDELKKPKARREPFDR